MPRILFIDDYFEDFAEGLKNKFGELNVLFQKIPNIRQINKKIADPPGVDVVLLDVLFEFDPDGTGCSAESFGEELLQGIKKKHDVPVLILTTTARETETRYPQASGIIQKPTDTSDQKFYNMLFDEVSFQAEISHADWDGRLGFVVGESPEMIKAAQSIVRFSKYHPAGTILVTGETGTGKELVCRALHRECGFDVGDGSYQVVHCGQAEPRDFRIALGGFPQQQGTEASVGVLETLERLNWKGTLLFDEIDDLNLECQNLLNRLLEGGGFQQENNSARVYRPSPDLRFLFTAQQNIAQLVEAGRFRKDLWARISGCIIDLPPLRERIKIIPQLYEALVREFTAGQYFDSFLRSDLKSKLEGYHWPENIRGFRNVIGRAVAQSANSPLRPEDIDFAPVSGQPTGPSISKENINKVVDDILNKNFGLSDIGGMGIAREGDLMREILKVLINKLGVKASQKSLARYLQTTLDIVKQILSKNGISLRKFKKNLNE